MADYSKNINTSKNKAFEPAGCKAYSGAGQSIVAIAEMTHSLPEDKKPVIIALYEGFDSTGYRKNPDILEAHNLFPGAFLQIGLQFPVLDNASLKKFGDGHYDRYIEEAADVYKSIRTPIFLRVGYEFDGEWNGYEPEAYIRAYRRVVDIFRQKDVDNVAYVWNSYVNNSFDMFKWYPDNPDTGEADGDDYVDWFCYNTVTARFDADWYMEQARIHGKPVMIGESSYAIVKEDYSFEKWLEYYFTAIGKYGVKGFQYINWDWSCYPENTGWTSWKNGRYTVDKELSSLYNSYMTEENLIFRDNSYHQPVALYIHCARGLREADRDYISWDPLKDHTAALPGFSYKVENTLACYGNGWAPFWEAREETVGIALKLKEKGTYAVTFKLGSNYSAESPEEFHVYVDGVRHDVISGQGGHCRIPVGYSDEVNIEISSRAHGKKVRVYEVGLLCISPDSLQVPEKFSIEHRTGGNLLSWTPVEGALLYNVYKNYQLTGMAVEAFYLDKGNCSGKDSYFISAYDEKNGEGQFTEVLFI